MTTYAIGDLHLPGGQEKPMNVFGAHWHEHFGKICADWTARVQDCDVVLLPGDFSWAMQIDDVRADIIAVGELPGRKILVRGNHDYWWGSISRVRDSLPSGMFAVQNDARVIEGVAYAGSRGWVIPPADGGAPEDVKIFSREMLRLELSLKDARRKLPGGEIIGMMHFPPTVGAATGFTRLFSEYNVKMVVYGHLHGGAFKGAFNGELDGVKYACVSCDGLGFRLLTAKY